MPLFQEKLFFLVGGNLDRVLVILFEYLKFNRKGALSSQRGRARAMLLLICDITLFVHSLHFLSCLFSVKMQWIYLMNKSKIYDRNLF